MGFVAGFPQVPYFLLAIACLLLGANVAQADALTDGAVLLAGGMVHRPPSERLLPSLRGCPRPATRLLCAGVAETTFCFLVSSVHPLTTPAFQLQAELAGPFWLVNGIFVAMVHLFAYHCVAGLS